MQVNPGTASRRLNDLLELGLIVPYIPRDDFDGRKKYFAISESGIEYIAEDATEFGGNEVPSNLSHYFIVSKSGVGKSLSEEQRNSFFRGQEVVPIAANAATGASRK